MIRAYANGGYCSEALDLYVRMRRIGLTPDNYTFPSVLRVCASMSWVLRGKALHTVAIRTGFESNLFVEAALVDMYAKGGKLVDARKVFDKMPSRDLVCWTSMITAYDQADIPQESLAMFLDMQKVGFFADSIAAISVASAVGQLGQVPRGQSVHGYVIRKAFSDNACVANSIIAMYAKCGNVEKARLVFDRLEGKNGISWNSMLCGYTQNGRAGEALSLFDQMLVSGSKPDPVTLLIMVSACSHIGSAHLGRKFHSFITNFRMEMNLTLWNALVDMYAKCGDLDAALEMFDMGHPDGRNVTSWNAIISGYGMHGQGKKALQVLSRMQKEGIQPNHITFASILSACSHAGLIDEGRKCFASMQKFSVAPEVKHYACMVDMLGRAGLLNEALDLIKEMPLEPSEDVWGAFLLACRIHRNSELGEIAAQNLFQLEPEHTGYYVLMSNIYAASRKWQEVGKLRQDMKTLGLKKPAALSVIEVGAEVYGFYTADQSNPCFREVYRKVEGLAVQLKMAGHVPDLSCVLHDVEEEDKEHILNRHSEKLAVAFGIMKMNPEMEILVTKNLRVCTDCHSALKIISYICGRVITVRDTNRFHRFEGGLCSCQDYW